MDAALVDLFKKVLEIQVQDTKKIYLYFVVIIAASIFSIIVNTIIQIILGSSSYKYDIRKIRNERCLKVVENLYSYLNSISDSLITNTPEETLKKVIQLRKWTSSNKIVLGKNIYKITIEILDYFSIVLSDRKKRNIKTENDFFNSFIKGYESLWSL